MEVEALRTRTFLIWTMMTSVLVYEVFRCTLVAKKATMGLRREARRSSCWGREERTVAGLIVPDVCRGD